METLKNYEIIGMGVLFTALLIIGFLYLMSVLNSILKYLRFIAIINEYTGKGHLLTDRDIKYLKATIFEGISHEEYHRDKSPGLPVD